MEQQEETKIERIAFEIDSKLKKEFEIAIINSSYESQKEAITSLIKQFVAKQHKKGIL